MLFGFAMVNGMPLGTVILEIARAEADQDLIAPRPDPVIGRPAAEPARLVIDLHVPGDGSSQLRGPLVNDRLESLVRLAISGLPGESWTKECKQ